MVVGDEGVGGEGAEVAVGAEVNTIRAPNPSISAVIFAYSSTFFQLRIRFLSMLRVYIPF